jgi:pathogenesis-related protein 1
VVSTAEPLDATAILSAHNKWRAEVGVADLTYALSLAASAQAWADHLKDSNACKMRHSEAQGRYGENLYWGSARQWSDGRIELQPVTAQKVIDGWGSEAVHYDHATNRCAPHETCGHYTQMVWRETTMVGCARAICDDTLEQVWVCQYSPPGNWRGEKPY